MDHVERSFIQAGLLDVEARVKRAAKALGWAEGQPEYKQKDLIPPIDSTDPVASAAAQADYDRYVKQVQTVAVRALNLKRSISIGEVNWGGDDAKVDKQLDKGLLLDLANDASKPLITNGITATRSYVRERDSRAVMEVLGGYLEPVWADEAIGADLVGLWQITASGSTKSHEQYNIRYYDFITNSVEYYDKRRNPTDVGTAPDQLDTGAAAYLPHVCWWELDQSGLPIGEISQNLPQFTEEIAQHIGIRAVSDAQGRSLLYMAGGFDTPHQIGRNTILVSHDPAGKAGRIEPGDLTQLFTEYDRTLERIRTDLSLPLVFSGSGDFPSGEAIAESHVPVFANARRYASKLSTNLTRTLADYCRLTGGIDAPLVSIEISREAMRRVISEQVREDYKAGIIDIRAAAGTISVYYPTWESKDIEAFIRSHEFEPTPATPPAGADEDEA